jgi:Xaa-Pro aminopeptidase
MPRATLREIDLPDFGMPETMPTIPDTVFTARLDRFRDRLAARGYDVGLVYADREHSANLAYLTGFDPRFEEGVLIVGSEDVPLLLTGNECVGMGEAAPLPMRVELHQEFSLPSQPRDRSRPLAEGFGEEGITAGARVGMIGWKESADRTRIEVPACVVDDVRAAIGESGAAENAGDILTNAQDGLRVLNEAEQLAVFEYAACHTSTGVRNLMFGLRTGMREDEAVRLLGWNGAPLSCHLMLTSGDRATLGLLSPSDRRIEHGDRFTTAFGIWGALNCRAGFVVEDATELPPGIEDYVDRLVGPYFEAIAEWYEALHVGQTGGVLQEIVDRRLGDPFFGIFLNPGHQLHLDEWVNSPVAPGSTVELRSGMVLQVDVIPATGTQYFTTNIEDGIALADDSLRREFSAKYPGAWQRIQARRRFMNDALGIALHPDVLPFSNIPAYLPPFLLRPGHAMTLAE